MSSSNPLSKQNYKQFFVAFFSEEKGFLHDFNLEGQIERMVVKSNDKKDFLRVELLFVVENGQYSHLFDIRYKHPHSPGFTRLQDNNIEGFQHRYATFSQKNIEELVASLSERLRLGWEEYRYFKKGKYYKSKVVLLSKKHPKIMVHRRENVGLGYLILSSLFGGFYRYFNKDIRVEHKIIHPQWNL